MSILYNFKVFVKISTTGEADGKYIEIPTEVDGTLQISNIQAQFPEATGLRYHGPSNAWRAVRRTQDILTPPQGQWGEKIYAVVKPVATGKIVWSMLIYKKVCLHHL